MKSKIKNKKKLKILLFTDNYNSRGGGAEKVFFKMIEELKKEYIDVYSFGFGNENIEKNDFKIIKETKSLFCRHFWRLFFNPLKYLEIRKYIKKINPDVIHIHNINKYTPSLLLALKGYKVVQTVHDYGLVCPTLWNVHNDLKPCPTGLRFKCLFKHQRDYNIFVYFSMLWFFLLRNFLLKSIVCCFISPSPQLKEYLDKNGFKNVKFIPNIIDIKNNIRPNFDKINPNQIIYLGQLEKNKGVHILINEMQYVVKENPKLILKIAGSGSEKENLIKLTKKLNLEKNIKFLGWVDNVEKLIQESIFLVVPSICMENSPVIVYESISFWRPILGSNRGGIPGIIKDKKTGIIFNPLKKNDLSKAILFVLKKSIKIDENYRNEILFDKKRVVKTLINVYQTK